jgi:hypothetical protein
MPALAATAAQRRLSALSAHLLSADQPSEYVQVGASLDRHRDGVSAMSQPSADAIVRGLQNARDLYPDPSENYAAKIPGPLHDIGEGKRFKDKMAIVWELANGAHHGRNHILWEEYAQHYGQDGMGSNIVVPHGVFGRDETTGRSQKPVLSQQVLPSSSTEVRPP